MKKIFCFLALIAALSAQAQESFHYQEDFKAILKRTKTAGDKLEYKTLLKRFNADDSTMTRFETLALLIGFTDKPEYKPYSDINTEREIYRLNDEGKTTEGMKLANSFLATHPLSVKALGEKAFAFRKMGMKDSADVYDNRVIKIFYAMMFSGKGFSPENPMFALGPADGQDFITKAVQSGIGTMGSGADSNGNFLDILEAKIEGRDPVKFYFIIQHATDKMFSEEEKKKMEKILKEAEKKDGGKSK